MGTDIVDPSRVEPFNDEKARDVRYKEEIKLVDATIMGTRSVEKDADSVYSMGASRVEVVSVDPCSVV